MPLDLQAATLRPAIPGVSTPMEDAFSGDRYRNAIDSPDHR
jgi:hypothetical protein